MILSHKSANVKFGFNTLPQLNSMANDTPKETKVQEFLICEQNVYHHSAASEKGYPAFEDAEEKNQGEEQKSRGQTPIL